MKIVAIETFPVRIPLKPERRMVSALGYHGVSDYLLVRLVTDTGIDGVGEATVTPCWSGETVWGAEALIRDVLAPVLVDCDVEDIQDIDRRMDAVAVYNWFAKSAIEMAAWDAMGKARRQPVYQLLGGPCRDRTVGNRFSLGAYPAEQAAQRARDRIDAGFTTIKIKVGTDPAADVERVRTVRRAVGESIDLTIDANGGWSFDQAVWCLQELADCDIKLVEQPLPRGDYSDLRRLRELVGCRVLADESCFDILEARELIQQQCCDALSVYPGKNGGIGKAKAIADLAAEHQVPCTIGSNLEWDVATAAMLHLIVATDNLQVETLPGDCLGPSYHEFSIATQPLHIHGPLTTLTDRPGLGVQVDWDLVARHSIPRALAVQG